MQRPQVALPVEGIGERVRSVAGRHFRCQEGVWVDFDYEAPQQTINVKRNSEEFRTLIIEDPGIGAAAQRLRGELIVMWKGKAYRIR